MYHVDYDLAVRSCRSPQRHTSLDVFPHFVKRDDAISYATRERRKREKAREADLRENALRLVEVRQDLAANPVQLSGESTERILYKLAAWYAKRENYGVLSTDDEDIFQRLSEQAFCRFRTYLEDRYRTSRFNPGQLALLYAQADTGRGVLKLEKRYKEYAAFAKAFATAR